MLFKQSSKYLLNPAYRRIILGPSQHGRCARKCSIPFNDDGHFVDPMVLLPAWKPRTTVTHSAEIASHGWLCMCERETLHKSDTICSAFIQRTHIMRYAKTDGTRNFQQACLSLRHIE